MREHLPECPAPFGVEPHVCTICYALRACEQRIWDEAVRAVEAVGDKVAAANDGPGADAVWACEMALQALRDGSGT